VKSRERQRICFSDAAAPQFSMLLTLAKRASEEILFSAICSALRFYTNKTRGGHERTLALSPLMYVSSHDKLLRLGWQALEPINAHLD
jgi:hypothetical protein